MLNCFLCNLPIYNMKCFLIYHIVIWGDLAGDYCFAQSPVGFNDHLIFFSCHRIYGEHDACGLCVNHLLNTNADEHILVPEPLLSPVEDGSRRE